MEDTYHTSNSDVVVTVSKDRRGELVLIEVYDIDSVLGMGPDFEIREGQAPMMEYAGHLPLALHREGYDLRTQLVDVKHANSLYKKDEILRSIAAVVMMESEEDEPL